jgi:hypothetical protein
MEYFIAFMGTINRMKLSTFLTVVIFMLSGCGDMKDHQQALVVVENSQLNPNCKIDEEKLALMLEQDVTADINCVEKTLNIFIKLVKSGKPGHLSQDELDLFLKKYFKEKHKVISSWLSLLFKFNYLLMDSNSQKFIHQEKLTTLFNILYYINKQAPTVLHSIRSEQLSQQNATTYLSQNRVEIEKFLETLKDYLEEVYRNPTDTEQLIDLAETLDNIKDEKNAEGIEKAKSFLFIKRLLLGGKSIKFSHADLGKLITKLPQIGMMVLDAYALSKINFDDDISQYSLLAKLTTNFKASIHYGQLDRTELFKVDEALNALSKIDGIGKDILKYKDAILKAKKVFAGNEKDSFTTLDLNNISFHVLYIVDKLERYNKFFNRFKNELTDPDKITFNSENKSFGYINSDYNHFKDFTRLVNRYRLYKGKQLSSIFSIENNKNFAGIIEYTIIEYLGSLFYKIYGVPDKNAYLGFRLEYENILKIMSDFSSYLIGNKIITDGRQSNTTETIILNSNLFNLTGNGGVTIELDEFVPFAVNVLSSMKVSQITLENLNRLCGNAIELKEVSTECYKKYFYEAYFDQDNLRPFLPRMMAEVDQFSREDKTQFIDEVQHFSRLCPYPDSKVTKGDMMAAIMGFYSIENAMIMFEKTGDNSLNREEVIDAYNFFEGALKRLLQTSDDPEKQNIQQRLSRAIFYYLVDYKKTPAELGDLMKVLAYQLRLKRPDGADRVTLAAILKTISTTSTTNRLNPGLCVSPVHFQVINKIESKFAARGKIFAAFLREKMQKPQRLNALVVADIIHTFGIDDAKSIMQVFADQKILTKFEISMILLDLSDYHKDKIGKKNLKKLKKWAKDQTFVDL